MGLPQRRAPCRATAASRRGGQVPFLCDVLLRGEDWRSCPRRSGIRLPKELRRDHVPIQSLKSGVWNLGLVRSSSARTACVGGMRSRRATATTSLGNASPSGRSASPSGQSTTTVCLAEFKMASAFAWQAMRPHRSPRAESAANEYSEAGCLRPRFAWQAWHAPVKDLPAHIGPNATHGLACK